MQFDVLSLGWIIVILIGLAPAWQRRALAARRQRALHDLQRQRGSRVIALIHRQESISFLGVPLARYIDIEDSEQVLRAIRLTPADVPIDLVVHTPGGLVLAAEQIAHALCRHQGPVTIFVPHYAMSGGTLVALACDQIVMDPNAVLGPVDPQLGEYPAASILAVVEQKPITAIDDRTLILADVARKAIAQVRATVIEVLLANGADRARADDLAEALATGRTTHDYPISYEEAAELGLPVSDDLPEEVHRLMALYDQPGGRRPSVQYIPVPYRRDDAGPDRRPVAPR